MLKQISPSEKNYIISGCSLGVRCDGRGPDDLRTIAIENNVFPQANGSCRITLGDVVDVLCSADIAEPDKERPDEGKLEINVDLSPSTRPNLDDRNLAALGAQIGETLKDAILGSEAINWKELCIIKKKFCWQVNVDILILRIDGDPTDICSLAIFAALHSAQLPKLELVVGKQGAFEDFEVVTDMAANIRLPLFHLPIIVTVHKVGGKMMIDCSHDEQQCSDAAVALAVNDLNQVCSTSFTKSGSLNSADLTRALECAVSAATSIYQQLNAFLEASQVKRKEEALYPDLAALRYGLLA
eukprot:scaffold6591_cov328-Ochromonas_danica.AAC.6